MTPDHAREWRPYPRHWRAAASARWGVGPPRPRTTPSRYRSSATRDRRQQRDQKASAITRVLHDAAHPEASTPRSPSPSRMATASTPTLSEDSERDNKGADEHCGKAQGCLHLADCRAVR